MKCDDWDRLDWTHQHRNKNYEVKLPDVQGFDTETYEGKAFMIAREDGRVCAPSDFSDCLSFLTQHSNRGKNNFFYNLKFDVQAMLKHAPESLWTRVQREDSVNLKGYEITCIPKKMLKIKKDKHVCAFYDLAQFMPGGLDRNAREYLGKSKREIEIDKLSDWDWVEDNWEKIKDYCIHDAKLCGDLGRHLRDLHGRMGVSFYKPVSPANISMRYVSSKVNLRRFYRKPWQEFAFKAYSGGRFELLQRGMFEDVYRYDINSAYPSIIADLPDLSKGYWKHSYNFQPDAELGYCKVEMEQRDEWATPVPFKPRDLVKFPRTKGVDKFITLNEFKALDQDPHSDVELKEGWFWFPRKLERPFEFLHDWYDRRKRLKREGDDLEWLIKVMMNSIYGKFIQVTPYLKEQDRPTDDTIYWKVEDGEAIPCKRGYKTGPFFCPAIAAKLCADVRLQIYDRLRNQRSDVIAAHTDSIFTTEKFSATGSKMGEWDLEGKGDLVIYATGIYSFRTDEGIKTRTRGFKLRDDKDLFQLLEGKTDTTKVKILMKHAASILEVLRQKRKYDLEDMNVIKPIARSADVNADEKRRWEGEFSSASEVLETSYSSETVDL